MNKFLIFSFLLLLVLIIPISFANDNFTDNGPLTSTNVNKGIISSNNIYFNASAENDGNGTLSNPYKYFSTNKIQDNSVLYFANGEYNLNKGFTYSNLTIIGNNPLNTKINGNNKVITSSGNLYITNITLDNLSIKNNYNLKLDKVIFQNSGNLLNDDLFGGAIRVSGSGTTLINSSTFKNNSAAYGGAIYASKKNNLRIFNSTFEDNHAYKYGGAIACEENNNLEISYSKFIDCSSITNAGGAVYSRNSTLNIRKSNFTSCNATFGGAICDLKSCSQIVSINAENNKADYFGGAIYKMYGTLILNSSSFFKNEALNGGAIYADNSSLLLIHSSSFLYNIAKNYGGAIYTILNDNESISSNVFKYNKAKTENNHYKGEYYNLFIGNGNYTLVKGDFEFNGTLPSKYDLRDYGYVTPVKNQKDGGNCWAFASLAVLESCILKATGESCDFSEENFKNIMALYSEYGWALETNDGGFDAMSIAYLTSWLGPVPENLETYSDCSALSPVFNSTYHVQNVIFLTRNNYTDNDNIKEAIIRYGGVSSGIYYSAVYNRANSYYYSGTESPNHDIVIVGWDDNYSKNNFRNTPEGDGAWICKNSWGETWGNKGYVYVSYYDTSCVKINESEKTTYTIILNDSLHYDKNYQYDIIGLTDYLITGKNTIWYENIFNATDNEFLTAFSTFFNDTCHWTAQIYVNNNLKAVKSGEVYNSGYYTFNLDEPITLNVGDTFKIVIKLSAEKYASFPISEKIRSNRELYLKGVSFFSFDGENWIDLYNYSANMTEFHHIYDSQVACIKAFTSLIPNTNIAVFINKNLIHVNESFNITATVKDRYGNSINHGDVKFTLDSKSYTVPIINYSAILTTQLDSTGIYKIKAEYLENSEYHSSSTSKKIYVNVTEVDLNLIVHDSFYGDKLLINTSLTVNDEKVQEDIIVKINSKTYSLKSNTETLIDCILNPGEYIAYATYSDLYNTSTTFKVNKLPISMGLNVNKIDVDSVIIAVHLSESINSSVKLIVNSKEYLLNTDKGIANLFLNNLDYGNYTVDAIFTNTFYENANASSKFSVNNIRTKLIVNNVTMYYHDGTRFYVTLVDKYNNPLVNENLTLSINGICYKRVTNDKGSCSIALNLNSGSYSVNVMYLGNGKYLSNDFTGNVLIKSTINSNDVKKIFKNGTQFYAKILDNGGNIVKNTTVTMNINGVFYYRTTNNEGVAKLNLNLQQGQYILTTNNPVTGENAANNITIIPTITENNDLVKYYKNNSRFSVKILSSDGSPLANAKITFNINGVFYERTTGSDGKASLAINLGPGEYIITTEYNGCRVSNNIKVLSVIISSDLFMRYGDGSQFKVKILDGLGAPYPYQNVVFNINGVFYERTTDENGIYGLNIRLQPGKYIITTSFNGLNVANKITISSN